MKCAVATVSLLLFMYHTPLQYPLNIMTLSQDENCNKYKLNYLKVTGKQTLPPWLFGLVQ